MEVSTDASSTEGAGRRSKRDASSPLQGPSGPPTKKAKPAASTTTTTATAPQPRLPAEVMGSVFDFMPYGEVRSALLAGKFVAQEVVKHVRTVSITEVSELNVPALRRFPNVEVVNVLCLLSPPSDASGLGVTHTISPDAARRIPLFLTHVAKLREAFVGSSSGLARMTGYMTNLCDGPRNHAEVFRDFVDGCLMAFQVKAFPSTFVSLEGFNFGETTTGVCRDVENPPERCTRCRNVCAHFPLAHVVHELYKKTCLSPGKVLDIVKSRPGGKTFIKENEIEVLVRQVRQPTHHRVEGNTNDHSRYMQRMRNLSVRPLLNRQCLNVRYLEEDAFAAIVDLVNDGLDPRSVSRERLHKAMLSKAGEDNRYFHVWAKGTPEKLIDVGFNINLKEFIVVDEKTEPVLRDLKERLYGSE